MTEDLISLQEPNIRLNSNERKIGPNILRIKRKLAYEFVYSHLGMANMVIY